MAADTGPDDPDGLPVWMTLVGADDAGSVIVVGHEPGDSDHAWVTRYPVDGGAAEKLGAVPMSPMTNGWAVLPSGEVLTLKNPADGEPFDVVGRVRRLP